MAVLSAVSARPLRAPCVEMKYCNTFRPSRKLAVMGLKLLQKAGITPAVVTGRDSKPLRLRLLALGITHARFGTEDKGPAALEILQELSLEWRQAAAMGDDWPDLAMMRRCAFACAPANAHAEVRSRAHHVTRAFGGAGAVRELCDLLLMASGHYSALLRGSLG